MLDLYDEQRDRQADDMIEKFIADGLTENQALAIWEKEQGICPICGADRGNYFEMMGVPCQNGHK